MIQVHRLLRAAGMVLALLCSCIPDVLGASRREIALPQAWRFHLGDDVPGAAQSSFDDTDWQAIAVPHTWNTTDATSPDMHRGVGWYRLPFPTPELSTGERVYLDFRGVSLVSTVWLNGHRVGEHANGFSAFRFDITDLLRRDGSNILVVRADSAMRDDLPPRAGDFSICGGIYRDVSLLVTPALGIDALDHASSGVYFTTPDISDHTAKLRARVRVRNTRDHPQPAMVRLELADASGVPVGQVSQPLQAPAGVSEAILELEVCEPHRWHGRIDPYLYTATVGVEPQTPDGAAAQTDAVSQAIGFRTFHIDPERGFFLNGQPYDLHGMNLHQDRAGRAWAVTPADHEEDFQLAAEMGCTFIRLVHYQHDRQALELADRLGLILWTEHALVLTVSDSPVFSERCLTNLRELVRQNFNHPSVIFWGIGNEVQTHLAPAKPLLEALARTVRLEDPARLSALATCFREPAGAYDVDALGHNEYFGWYRGTFADFPVWLDSQRAKAPGLGFGMAEYGAGAGVTIHSATPVALDHTEEYQALFHESYWRTLRARPWVSFKAVWQLTDNASNGRKEGDTPGINDKGLVTHDRRTRKDAYYWYQANWTTQPMVHVTSRRFVRTEVASTIKVYSNCDTVELQLNGRSLGRLPVDDHVATWSGVILKPGANQVVALGHRASDEIRDECTLTLRSR
jgi:beta-galactosidase